MGDLFSQALSLHRAGRLEEAQTLYQEVLDASPDHAEALNLLGAIALQRGDHIRAVELIRQAIALRSNEAAFHCNLCSAYRALDRFDEAVASARAALALQPGNGQIHFMLGTLLLTCAGASAAEPHLRQAAELLPGDLSAQVNLASCLIAVGREREAIEVYDRSYSLASNDLAVGVTIGKILLGCREYTIAQKWFAAVLKADSNQPEAIRGLAHAYLELDRRPDAIALYEIALEQTPMPDVYDRLAATLMSDFAQVKRAERLIREAVERFPDEPMTHVRLGLALAANGDSDGAVAAFRAALRVRPGHPFALAELATRLGNRLPESERAAAEAALRQSGADEELAALHFGVAKVEDDRDNFSQAAEHARLGNAHIKAWGDNHARRYDPEILGRNVGRFIATMSPSFFNRAKGMGHPSNRPVFVFGMPRSGSTLVEQILASHSRVFGAGEMRFAEQSLARLRIVLGSKRDPIECLDGLTRESVHACADWYLQQFNRVCGGAGERAVDKKLDNCFYLGWLAILFPNARFIHCRRDLRDVALSCWMTNFNEIHWANDLGLIAGRIREYQRIMAHWKEVLPVPMLDVHYEKMIADQEGESRRLIQSLGLEWEPECLAFYRTKRPVRTASVLQVRQPIYARSVGRWRHYRDTLRPLIEELGLGMD